MENLVGFFNYWPEYTPVGISVLGVLILGYFGLPFWAWAIFTDFLLLGFGAPMEWVIGVTAFAALFIIVPIRRAIISAPLMKVMKNIMPDISQTERTALEAGVVWAEAELFSGRPNFKKLMSEPYPELTPEEKAFLEGPTEEICRMTSEWDIWKTREIPKHVFQFLKDKGFLGMIIPKEYGGLGFSAYCHSQVIMKMTSRSVALGVTAMVPNSLGPAELLIHYGTDEQKRRWLPGLAKGVEIPCFGLTEPQAGSDAGAIESEGILFKGEDGKIYVRLKWRKRWITLAAISTVIGLAFKLRDPDNILGKGEDLGITCALIPAKAPGVVVGRRHDPLGVPFYNCPTEGANVVLNAEEAIIGGLAGSGKGWKMLMECLAAGRGISLPAQSTVGAKLVARVTSAHAVIRKQFGVSIGKFEGLEEPLARIGGTAYFLEAMRKYTLSALDQGLKPPVVTAMAKYQATENNRKCVNDGMDIMGGAGISLGPRNLMAVPYIANPIGITVEGANILTRTLMVFGQGAMRAHPFAFKEVDAVEKNDLPNFDVAFWGHIGHVVHNIFRSAVLSLSRGYLGSRGTGGVVGRHFQRMAWASASFAILADMSMGLLGGQLKFKEKITGRFADILSWMYIGTAVLRRFEAEGRRPEDLPFVNYSMKHAFAEIQKAFDGILYNFDVPFVSLIFKKPIYWWSSLNRISGYPSDRLGHKVVECMLADSEQRDRLTDGIYIPQDKNEALGRLEYAFKIIKKSEDIERKIRKAIREKRMAKVKGPQRIEEALAKGIITPDEKSNLLKAEEARWDAIQVDDFSESEYHSSVEGVAPRPPLDSVYGK